MSCNGCRVLRKGCSDGCVLRPSIEWIEGPQAQAHATVFVAKFFGRAGLVASLAAVPLPHRPALFRSLLYEACGRTINPVSGAVGLMWTGNWDLCQAAADAVLRGESLRPAPDMAAAFADDDMAGLYGTAGTRAAPGGFSSSSPENSSSAPPGKRKKACGSPEEQCDLDLCLMPRSPPGPGGGSRRRGATPEDSTTTCDGEGGNNSSSGTLVDVEAGPTLLNLFH